MDGIAWASSAMVAARARLEIAAQNLANVSTDNFRPMRARGLLTPSGVTISREPLPQPGKSIHAAGFVRDRNGALRDGSGRRIAGPRLSNGVDAISQMIDVLAAERAFESAQKAVTAIDSSRQKSAEAARIK